MESQSKKSIIQEKPELTKKEILAISDIDAYSTKFVNNQSYDRDVKLRGGYKTRNDDVWGSKSKVT